MGTMTDNLVKNVETSLRRVQDPTNNTAIEIGKFKDAVKNEGSEIDEKWSKKYKDSIDCSNPKGFSQKAHCQGKKKKEAVEATSSASSGQYSAPLFSLATPQDPVTKVQESIEGGETTEATGA